MNAKRSGCCPASENKYFVTIRVARTQFWKVPYVDIVLDYHNSLSVF